MCQHPRKDLPLGNNNQGNVNEAAQHESMSQLADALIHASRCANNNCNFENCQHMKGVIQHVKECGIRSAGGCAICKGLVILVSYHAKHCQDANCSVRFCANVKNRIESQGILNIVVIES